MAMVRVMRGFIFHGFVFLGLEECQTLQVIFSCPVVHEWEGGNVFAVQGCRSSRPVVVYIYDDWLDDDWTTAEQLSWTTLDNWTTGMWMVGFCMVFSFVWWVKIITFKKALYCEPSGKKHVPVQASHNTSGCAFR